MNRPPGLAIGDLDAPPVTSYLRATLVLRTARDARLAHACKHAPPSAPSSVSGLPIRRLVPAASPRYGRHQGRYLQFCMVVGTVSGVPKRIRVTGTRRETIDTDRLAALLLRAAQRAQNAADTPTADSGCPNQDAAVDDNVRSERDAA
jgi:hypothetical protein